MTHDAVCPRCGHVEKESYSLGRWERRNEGEDDCKACERPYHWRRIVEIRYETEPVDEESE